MEDDTFTPVTLMLLRALLRLLFVHLFHKYFVPIKGTLSGPGNKMVSKTSNGPSPHGPKRLAWRQKKKYKIANVTKCWKEGYTKTYR